MPNNTPLRTLVRQWAALKVNKVWPWLAVRMLYGWRDGAKQWKGTR